LLLVVVVMMMGRREEVGPLHRRMMLMKVMIRIVRIALTLRHMKMRL
jgi:hypothetical protein